MEQKQKRPSVWKAALVLVVPGGEVESPCLAAAVFETATSTDSVTPAGDVATHECRMRAALKILARLLEGPLFSAFGTVFQSYKQIDLCRGSEAVPRTCISSSALP